MIATGSISGAQAASTVVSAPDNSDLTWFLSGLFIGSAVLEREIEPGAGAWGVVERIYNSDGFSFRGPKNGSIAVRQGGNYRFRIVSPATNGTLTYSLAAVTTSADPAIQLLGPQVTATGQTFGFKPNNTMVINAHGTTSIPDNNVVDTASNSMNCRAFAQAPTMTGLTDIVLAFPGFGFNIASPEVNLPAGYTVTASVEYPIGATPKQVFFNNGATSAAVAVGRTLVKSDPLPLYIPPGAQFAVKCFVTWTAGQAFWINQMAQFMTGEWCNRGTGLADHTLDNAVQTQTTNQGFAPIVFGTPSARTPVIGIVGDSIGRGQMDQSEPISQTFGMQRGLQGILPCINMSIGGHTLANYLSRPEGRNLVLRDRVTHVVIHLGANDINGGASLATMQSNLAAAAGNFLSRGVKVYTTTITPNTTSSDHWVTLAGQTTVSGAADTVRMAYNDWLRKSWQALGLSGIFDTALAVDPTLVAKWANPDGLDAANGISTANDYAGIYATIVGGTVTAIAPQSGLAAGYVTCGSGYPIFSSLLWNTYPQLGDLGGGATGTIAVNGSGQLLGATTITSPGSGYVQAPMVNVQGPLTAGGLHPGPRGYNEMIYRTGFGAGAFAL